jgi:hypothetical protein
VSRTSSRGSDRSTLRRAALTAACLLLAGCAAFLPPAPRDRGAGAVVLDAIPFFPQTAYHCGPAALATVLSASGADVTPDALAPALYVPGRRGTFQAEMIAATRGYDRLAVPIPDTLEALVAELEAGRPVVVLQNLALRRAPRWHYAVVVGYLPDADRLVLNSGTREHVQMQRSRFLATWNRADRWAFVVLAPGDSPGTVDASAYLKAAAGLESAGRHEAAHAAFVMARRAWPEHPTAALGVANNLYRLGRIGAAEAEYRALVDAGGGPVALHNLVMLLVEQDRPCDALAVLAQHPQGSSPLERDARAAAAAAPGAGDCDAAARSRAAAPR